MGQKESSAKTLAAFREATMELDNLYSRFPKSCGLSEAEYWSLLLIYEGIVTQSRISEQLFLSRSAHAPCGREGLAAYEPGGPGCVDSADPQIQQLYSKRVG